MVKVYLVSSGQYSDYCIDGAFSTKELAEARAACIWDADIEEWDLDEKIPTPHGYPFEVIAARSGDNFACLREKGATHPATWRLILHRNHVLSCKGDPAPRPPYKIELQVRCYARDLQHAAKIANEIRAQVVAAGQWPDIVPEPPDMEVFEERLLCEGAE